MTSLSAIPDPEGFDPKVEVSGGPISTLASTCATNFNTTLQLLSEEQDKRHEVVFRKFEKRFLDWAGYLGVFAGGNGSLDHRLKSHPQYRGLVLLAMDMLNVSLIQTTTEPSEPSSDESSDDEVERWKIEAKNILESINELDRLAIHIRQSSTSSLDARVKAFEARKPSEVSFYEARATLAVNGLYPEAFDSLRRHLSKSMTQRYTRLLYWQSHEKKLRANCRRDKQRPDDPIPSPRKPSPLPPKASSLPRRPARDKDPAPPNPGESRLSYGTSFLSGTWASELGSKFTIPPPPEAKMPAHKRAGASSVLETRAKFPNPPKFEDGEDRKLCPLCRKIFLKEDFTDSQWWRAHVNDDLMPFVCVSRTCIESPSFSGRTAWKGHIGQCLGDMWLQKLNTDDKKTSDTARAMDTCPLCCFPLAKLAKLEASILQASESETPPSMARTPSGNKGTLKSVRFDVSESDTTVIADTETPIVTDSVMMLDHIADHLQFLALLTPRLSTEKLGEGGTRTFSSDQGLNSYEGDGERSTLDDDFESAERDKPQDADIGAPLVETTPSKATLDQAWQEEEEIESGEAIDWSIVATLNTPNEGDGIIEHMKRVRAHDDHPPEASWANFVEIKTARETNLYHSLLEEVMSATQDAVSSAASTELETLENEICHREKELRDAEYHPDLLVEIHSSIARLVCRKNADAMAGIASLDSILEPDNQDRGAQNADAESPAHEKEHSLSEVSKDIARLTVAIVSIPAPIRLVMALKGALADMLVRRGKMTGDQNDIEIARIYFEDAMMGLPKDDTIFERLVMRYFDIAYKQNLETHPPTQAITTAVQQIVSILEYLPTCLAGYPNVLERARDRHLGEQALDEYVKTRVPAQLELALKRIQKAPETSDDEFDVSYMDWLLGRCHYERYEASGHEVDLELALEFAQAAVAIKSSHDLLWSKTRFLLSLGPILLTKEQKKAGEQKADSNNVREFVRRLEEVINLAPPGHPRLPELLIWQGISLHHLYLATKTEGKAEEAIGCMEEALRLSNKSNNAEKAICLMHLADMHLLRWENSRNTPHLRFATRYAEDAVELVEKHGPEIQQDIHGKIYMNLSTCYSHRYQCKVGSNRKDDLIRSIEKIRKAIAATPSNDINYGTMLTYLGRGLTYLYDEDKNQGNLDEAVNTMKLALDLTHPHSNDRAKVGSALARLRFKRWQTSKHPEDLDIAINQAREAGPDTLDEALFLCHRAVIKSSLEDLQLGCLKALKRVQDEDTTPSRRIAFARQMIHMIHKIGPEGGNGNIFDEWVISWKDQVVVNYAMTLLPVACIRDQPRNDQHLSVRLGAGLAADGCSLAIKCGNLKEAVKRLEYGRCLILGYFIDRDDDFNSPPESFFSQSRYYRGLRYRAFRQPVDHNDENTETFFENQRKAQTKLKYFEEKIGELPGFDQFQGPMYLQELQQLTVGGPVVAVNITDISSDAIIITHNDLKSIPLPKMHAEMLENPQMGSEDWRAVAPSPFFDLLSEWDRNAKILSEPSPKSGARKVGTAFLSSLWYNCVSPILEELDLLHVARDDNVPRIWWIGSGAAASLPFHAAGDYGRHAQQDVQIPRTCLECVASSYIPTIKSLQDSRKQAQRVQHASRPTLMCVTMEHTPGLPTLPGVNAEGRAVEDAVADLWDFTLLKQPDVPQVVERLKTSQIAHFACHGQSEVMNPSDSNLLLERLDSGHRRVDKLTVGSILDAMDTDQAWLVYLSACSTAQDRNKDLTDENLHLASAFQMAGFAHTIGSLWPVSGYANVEIASLFYRNLVADSTGDYEGMVSKALRKAIMELRGRYPLYHIHHWTAFVHFGA